MRCPKCSKEMERGYTTADRGLSWQIDKKKRIITLNKEYLISIFDGLFRTRLHPSWNCGSCKLVLIDYTEKSSI